MSDEPEIQAIHFTQAVVLTVQSWPARTAFTDEFLRNAHVQKATHDREADTVTIHASNGTATCRIRRDLPKQGRAWVAYLVEGDTPSRLRQRAAKFGVS